MHKQSLHFKTIWISDVHIGTRACKAEMLKVFLKRVTADRIYLVGDIIDGWSLRRRWYWPKSHNDLVRQIIKVARNSEVIYIPGNHDEIMRDYCPLNFGDIEMKTYDIYTTSQNKQLVVLHGDIFDAFITNSKAMSLLGDAAYDILLSLNNMHHWMLSKAGRGYWSLSDYIKSRTKEALRAVEKFECAALEYAGRKQYDGIVCGHIHSAAIKEDDGLIYINDGDWVESCTAAYEDFEGNLGILNWADHYQQEAD